MTVSAKRGSPISGPAISNWPASEPPGNSSAVPRDMGAPTGTRTKARNRSRGEYRVIARGRLLRATTITRRPRSLDHQLAEAVAFRATGAAVALPLDRLGIENDET